MSHPLSLSYSNTPLFPDKKDQSTHDKISLDTGQNMSWHHFNYAIRISGYLPYWLIFGEINHCEKISYI